VSSSPFFRISFLIKEQKLCRGNNLRFVGILNVECDDTGRGFFFNVCDVACIMRAIVCWLLVVLRYFNLKE
jgi:hypothetical protein